MKKIEFSSLNLHAFIYRELNPVLPALLENAYLSEEGFACFVFGSRTMALSLSQRHPFLFFTEKRFKKRKTGFTDFLQKQFKGLTAVDARQEMYDRMFRIVFGNGRTLRFNLIPGQFNIVATDSSDTVLGIYSYKKDKNGNLLFKVSDKFSASPSRHTPESALDSAAIKLISDGLVSRDDMFTENTDFYPETSGGSLKILPVRLGEGEHFVSEIINSYLASERKETAETAEKKRVDSILKKISAIEEKISRVEPEDAALRRASETRARAERAKAMLSAGAEASDAKQGTSPAEYMNMLFEEAKEIVEKAKRNKILIEKYSEEIERLKKEISLPSLSGQERRKPPQKEKRAGRRFTSPSGLFVLSGRNASENDILLKSSKRGDIYFHANEAHGSAVILKAGEKAQKADIEFAASVAAYFSEGKHSSLVSVLYEDVKYVVKRKGDPKGMAHMLRSKSVMVRPADLH